VADSRGLLLGTALYSPASQIALRMVTREAIDEPAWLKLLEFRLRESIDRRLLKAKDEETDSCRLCFSEADQLPGLIIDKYGPLIIVQRLARALYASGVSETCVRVLRDLLEPATILERPDQRIRELEDLPAVDPAPLWAKDPPNPSPARSFASTASASTTTPIPARRPEPSSTSAPTTPLHRSGLGFSLQAAVPSMSAPIRADSLSIWLESASASPASTPPAPPSKSPSATSKPIAINSAPKSIGSKPTLFRSCATGPLRREIQRHRS